MVDNSIGLAFALVMESWEKPYMEKLADLAAEGGGDILEILGMQLPSYLWRRDLFILKN